MIVRVNGAGISEDAINAELQHHPAASLEEARLEATRALVIRELLLQAANARGITEPDPLEGADDGQVETREAGLIRTVIACEVKIPEPDEATCRRYYENNRHRFRSPELFEAAHILFLADPKDGEATARANEEASAALARARECPEVFGSLARELSACSSGKDGGSLGQITRGSTVPEFETFLTNLEPGQICPVPVRTRFGYHVLRLDRRIDGRQLPFEVVREKIADYLRERVWRRAVSQYLSLLVGQADIEGVELNGAKSLLVQ